MSSKKLTDYMKTQFTKQSVSNLLLNLGYWLFAVLYLEVLVQISTIGQISSHFLLTVGFSSVFACGLALVTSFIPKKANFIITVILTVVVIVLYGSQMVYFYVFGSLYSVSQIGQGGDAITTFYRELLTTMAENAGWIALMFVPIVPGVLLRIFRRNTFSSSTLMCRVLLVVVAVILQVASTLGVYAGGTATFSNHYFYTGNLTTMDQAAERFGLFTAFRLDLLGGSAIESPEEDDYFVADPLPTEPLPTGEDVEPPQYNVLDINFDDLLELTENEKHKTITNYVRSLPGTLQNEYTGMLSDYNLILICAESFATGAIHPELTPTLYRMSREGFIFNNYYNTYPNNTTDGEYTLCMGLFPDTSRNKDVASFYASRKSYLPFCLGNVFKQQKGIETFGYHNNGGSYYGRDETHPNMGYTTKFAGKGMKFTSSWPCSDLEMFEQTVQDWISMDQFHAYYMTFSGHMKYNTSVNAMAARNWKHVKDLEGYSYAAKCYLACNYELEKAMAYLMEQLETAGVADKTAIVLTGDHFPYGLTDKQYSELVGYKIDKFTKQKSSLLFWVGGMEENIEVDTYCCNVDILPTLLNLWGFSYDSRLLAGTDIFSNGTHVAVLNDTSFFTDKVWLHAGSGEVRYLVPESEVPANYIENMVKLIKTKYNISKDMLNSAYYNHVFEQGDVKVNWGSWGSWTPKPKPTTTAPATTPATTPSGPAATTPPGGGGTGGGTGGTTDPSTPTGPQPSTPPETQPPQPSTPQETQPVQPSTPPETQPPQPSTPQETQPPQPNTPPETQPPQPQPDPDPEA